MWEGPTKRGEEGGVQSPLAEQYFGEVLKLISRTSTLLPAPGALPRRRR